MSWRFRPKRRSQAGDLAGKKTITGAAVIALQAVEQFVLYTGVRPDTPLVEKAAAFARRNLPIPAMIPRTVAEAPCNVSRRSEALRIRATPASS